MMTTFGRRSLQGINGRIAGSSAIGPNAPNRTETRYWDWNSQCLAVNVPYRGEHMDALITVVNLRWRSTLLHQTDLVSFVYTHQERFDLTLAAITSSFRVVK